MYKILKLNEISASVEKILSDNYTTCTECAEPDAIVLRSFKMHSYPVADSVLAVARAGAGVNNIPVDEMTDKGIVVFNTPGANANAVKELVICSMIVAGRKIVRAINWTNGLKGESDVAKLVEKGKKQFVGAELAGKTLGVIGLGAIGRMVANTAIDLDMNVLGYDPYLSVDGAWSLSSKIKHVIDVGEIFAKCDFITLHVPLTDSTREIVNAKSIKSMKKDVKIINCSRGELVCNADIVEAVKNEAIGRYVTDFPTPELLGYDNIICIPHLGASTPEAEDNCAVMAAKEIKDYLENGNITNSVNFPGATAPRTRDSRITIMHVNRANMIATATGFISDCGINIDNLVSSSKGDIAYMILDIDGVLTAEQLTALGKIDGFIRVREIK